MLNKNVTKLKLNNKQVDKISDICSDIGLITLAAVVLPSFLDRLDIQRLLIGLMMSFLLWFFSVKLKS